MKSAKILREKLESGQVILGIMTTFHLWLDLIEIAIKAGLDYLIIDTEHVGHDHELIADGCAFGRRSDFPVLIRPPQTEYAAVHTAADLGPCGLLLPMVESARQLDEAQQGIRMPPRGRRRPGGWAMRWSSSVDFQTVKTSLEDDFIVIPQIESPEGLSNVAAIAAHELTTALGIGPYDLSARLGVCWRSDFSELNEPVAKIRKAAEEVNKRMWIIGDPDLLMEEGFRFLCVGDPIAILESTMTQTVNRLRDGSTTKGARTRG